MMAMRNLTAVPCSGFLNKIETIQKWPLCMRGSCMNKIYE